MISPEISEASIQQHEEELSAVFDSGATTAELDGLEGEIGFELPDSFRAFYLLANGQKADESGFRSGVPAIPALILPSEKDTASWGDFSPVAAILCSTKFHREFPVDLLLSDFDGPDDLRGFASKTEKHLIFSDPGSGGRIGLVYAPGVFDTKDSFCVMAFNHDPPLAGLLAPTFGDFLEMVNDSILSDEYCYSEDFGNFVSVNAL